MKWLPYNLDILLPGLALVILAFAMLVLTVQKAYGVLDFSSKKYVTYGSGIEVQRVYLGRNDYLEYAPTLVRLNPGVAFAIAEDHAITMAINNEELFPDLMMALHTLQSYKPGVAWELVELCVRKCPEGAIARASVKGFRQEVR